MHEKAMPELIDLNTISQEVITYINQTIANNLNPNVSQKIFSMLMKYLYTVFTELMTNQTAGVTVSFWCFQGFDA